MQALKALVIFMGVLIMAGMALLVYGLATRTGGGPGEFAEASGGGAADFGTLELALPDGCSLAATETAGDRLVIRFDGQAERGCQQLVVVDLASGKVLGRVKALPAGAGGAR
ncbi:MAG: hypothetical protein RH942_12160 [Kiloniellaceae bacterium]